MKNANIEYLKEVLKRLIENNIKTRAERDFYKRNAFSRELVEEVKNLNIEIEEFLKEIQST